MGELDLALPRRLSPATISGAGGKQPFAACRRLQGMDQDGFRLGIAVVIVLGMLVVVGVALTVAPNAALLLPTP